MAKKILELENRISELENIIGECKDNILSMKEALTRMETNENEVIDEYRNNLVSIMHTLTRMETNENEVIDKYKDVRLAESLYTIVSYISNEHLINNYPELLTDDILQKYKKLFSNLNVYKIKDKHREVHMGVCSDGGYTVIDNFEKHPNKILYAMGIGDDVSFEKDMADLGFQVFMYDHTVDAPPTNHQNFHFIKKGLIGHHDDSLPELMTIEEMLKTNGHCDENDIFLKCDIEGFEIDVINEMPTEIIIKFTEIVLELHLLTDRSKIDDIISALDKLNKTHKLVHIHPNNIPRALYIGNMAISDCIELTYVRSSDYKFTKMTQYRSGKGDYPCNKDLPERLFYYQDVKN